MGLSVPEKVPEEMTLMKMASFSRVQDELLPEDRSIIFPMPVLLVNEDPREASLPRGHCRSLSAPAEASSNAAPWDLSPGSFQHLKENLHGWKWKMMRKNGDKKKRALSDRRVALEEDVAHLQTQLQTERAVRQGLERALGQNKRVSAPLPSEVPSSTYSPKAKELITEIASLETEVASLEQHVLSLYRKVLDTQISPSPTVPSGEDVATTNVLCPPPQIEAIQPQPRLFSKMSLKRKSPPLTSHHRRSGSGPGTPCNEAEEKPSSSSQIKSRHVSLLGGAFNCMDGSSADETQQYQIPVALEPATHLTEPVRVVDIHLGATFRDTSKKEQLTRAPHSAPLPHLPSGANSTPGSEMGSRKFYTESPRFYSGSPNRLSEDLVRCMAAIYCKLADPVLSQSGTPISPASSNSSSSASSTTTTSSPQGFSSGSWSPRWGGADNPSDVALADPFQLRDRKGDVVGTYSSAVEVPWICIDKDRLNYAARALRNFRSMVEQLEKVDPGAMKHEEKTAFWINVYNALMMHAYLAYGIPRSHLKRIALVQKASYKIGPHSINAHTIEQCILGCRARRPTQWLQTLFTTGPRFKPGDERRSYALDKPEPMVCFALCGGGRSDPAIRVYSAKHVREELETARREYLQASIGVRSSSRVLLPRILEWYAREVAITPAALLNWVCQYVTDPQQMAIRKCLQSRSHKSAAQSVEWLPYNSGFRYIFVRELARITPLARQ